MASMLYQHTAFFDDFAAKTLIRTAWYPFKWETIGTTFEQELELHGLRAEFAAAETRMEMLRALHKLIGAARSAVAPPG